MNYLLMNVTKNLYRRSGRACETRQILHAALELVQTRMIGYGYACRVSRCSTRPTDDYTENRYDSDLEIVLVVTEGNQHGRK